MSTTDLLPLSVLYEQDETAWLEAMSHLASQGRRAELDLPNLSEYLIGMANRDRREVSRRLVPLLTHLLKWVHQPERRSGSWQGTVLEQRRELRTLLESGTLRNHAVSILAQAYADAQKQAAAETGLPRETFPLECGWDIETLLAEDEDESQNGEG